MKRLSAQLYGQAQIRRRFGLTNPILAFCNRQHVKALIKAGLRQDTYTTKDIDPTKRINRR